MQPHLARFANVDEPFGLCSCPNCGFLYLSPRPTWTELSDLYESHPYYSAENATRGESRRRFYSRKLARLERWRPERGRMLAIGCLEGGYAPALARARGWQVEAVESSPVLAAHARSLADFPVHVASRWDLSCLGERRFDVVYTHSLEHVAAPRQILRQCARLLTPDGLLFLEVPHQLSSLMELLKRGLFRLAGARADRWIQRERLMLFHQSYFTPRTLRAMLAAEGFTVLALRTYLPGHPLYLGNGTRRWVQEVIHACGALAERGPCIEVVGALDGRARNLTASQVGGRARGARRLVLYGPLH
jgi:2-polyprenyl-3-methyl-5-hydroxy-6-metoxy-1,4-benzoquinol methylase